MKFKGTLKGLIKRWRDKVESKNALGESYPRMASGKLKKEAAVAFAEARVYEICADELEMLEAQAED